MLPEGERQKLSQQGCSSLQSQTQASPTFSQGNFFLDILLPFFTQKILINLLYFQKFEK